MGHRCTIQSQERNNNRKNRSSGKKAARAKAALKGAALVTLSAYAAASYISRISMDRRQPASFRYLNPLIKGKKGKGSFESGHEEEIKALAESDNETVKIEAHDGTLLVGHWIPAENPKRVLIAMHGWRSRWYRDFCVGSRYWSEMDCSVLYAEQRGQGESGGDYIGFGPLERHDCLDWIDWVRSRCGDEFPIYLVGISMGATTVLMAGGLDLPGNVHGIVADCGFTSPHAIWKHVARRNMHMPFILTGWMSDRIYERKVRTEEAGTSTIDAMRRCKVPVLFIHGDADRFIPVEMTYENYDACASPKEILIVAGAEHGMSCAVDPKQYMKMVSEFWEKYD